MDATSETAAGVSVVAPRVKELQRETAKLQHAALLRMCECVDQDGRTIFHYASPTLVELEDADPATLRL